MVSEIKYSKEVEEESEDFFATFESKDTEYIKEQLDFMESVTARFPDGTTFEWGNNASGRYDRMVESFGEVEEYIYHLEDGSVLVFVE